MSRETIHRCRLDLMDFFLITVFYKDGTEDKVLSCREISIQNSVVFVIEKEDKGLEVIPVSAVTRVVIDKPEVRL